MAAALPLQALLPATILYDNAPMALAASLYCLYMHSEHVHMHSKHPWTIKNIRHPALRHEGRLVASISTAE